MAESATCCMCWCGNEPDDDDDGVGVPYCSCCDPYTSEACEICVDCVHTVRIPRPKTTIQRWESCRRHVYVEYAYGDEEQPMRVCLRCGCPEPSPLDFQLIHFPAHGAKGAIKV